MPEENSEITEQVEEAPEGAELTTEQLKAELTKARQDAAARRVKNRELEEAAASWKKHQDAQLSELERAKKAEADARAELEATRAEKLKVTVAAAKKVPSDLAGFLTGTTQEELEASADTLLAHLKPLDDAARPDPLKELLAKRSGKPIGKMTDVDVDALIRRR